MMMVANPNGWLRRLLWSGSCLNAPRWKRRNRYPVCAQRADQPRACSLGDRIYNPPSAIAEYEAFTKSNCRCVLTNR